MRKYEIRTSEDMAVSVFHTSANSFQQAIKNLINRSNNFKSINKRSEKITISIEDVTDFLNKGE